MADNPLLKHQKHFSGRQLFLWYTELGTHNIFVPTSRVAASRCFINTYFVTAVFFPTFFTCHASSFSKQVIIKNFLVIEVQLLKLVSTPIFAHKPLPNLLAVKFWQSFSPLSTQQSSSTPADGQIHPFPLVIFHYSPPSSHPPPLMAVKFTPPCPAVIIHPCWRPTSPLPAQQSSSTPPIYGHIHPSHPLLVFQGERDKEGRGGVKRGDVRQ